MGNYILFSVYCSDCNCEGCFNTTQNETLVEEARRHALDRDPTIFESKIYSNDSNLNKKGCKCTKTNCLKVSIICIIYVEKITLSLEILRVF